MSTQVALVQEANFLGRRYRTRSVSKKIPRAQNPQKHLVTVRRKTDLLTEGSDQVIFAGPSHRGHPV